MRKNILAGFILLISLSAGIEAQELDQDCNPLAVPAECMHFSGDIRALENRIARLQERLRGASSPAKADLVRNIRRLNSQLDAVRADRTRCIRDAGATPRQLAPGELTSRFTGTATVRTTDGNAAGPFDVDLDLDLRFSRNRCSVTITRFPRLNLRTKRLPVIGRITVTVTKTGGGSGSFHPVSGTMNIPIILHFHYDTALISDDDANFDLTTGRSVSRNGAFDVTGSPLTQEGSISLTGTTRFRNGYLEGKEGSLVITANISPRP
jgi:hypothetical protein